MKESGTYLKYPILGIDEAGRGPVIGPLVVAGVICRDGSDVEILKSIGVRDSKKLSRKKRNTIYKSIIGKFKIKSVVINPTIIDRSEFNLNVLEYHAMREIICFFNPRFVIIDSVGTPDTVRKYFNNIFPDIEFHPVYRADVKYPVVSAASIVAKETREMIVKDLHEKYGEFGSGYPSDSNTRNWILKFLNNDIPMPDIVRRSWATISNLRNESNT